MQKRKQKAIPQKRDIIDIRKFLPRGTITKLAKKHKCNHQIISYVAKGQTYNPIIYAELLEAAEKNQDIIKLDSENRQKAEKLLNL